MSWRLLLIGLLPAVLLHGQDSAEPLPEQVDLLVVGGTESGCAAAIQACRMGVKSVLLVNDIDWLGGQFSAEALGAVDENRARGGTNETPFPRSGLFREVMDRIEASNQKKYGSPTPGNAIVKTTVRPADAARIFREMVQPYLERGQLRIVSGYHPESALLEKEGNLLTGLRFAPTSGTGRPFTVRAKITIDASDWGEAIRAAKAEYECGPDLKSRYGEPAAPTDPQRYPPTEMDPITWCVVVEETDRESVIPRPEGYDARRYYRDIKAFDVEHRKLAWPHNQNGGGFGTMQSVYTARRLIQQKGHDVLLLNRPTMNYPLDRLPQHVIDELERIEKGASARNIVEMTREQREVIFRDAKRQALGFLYFLQTDVHDRLTDAEKPYSVRRFRLSEEFGTADQLPPKPYVRESLRLRAMYMMREQDTLNADRKEGKYAAQMYDDGVGCWQFEYDFHPTGRAIHPTEKIWECYFKPGRGWGVYSDRALLPIRSLIPVRVDGLLGAQKNLGFSSIVCSAVRLHDQSMMVGQASGATAAVCLKRGVQPREVPYTAGLLQEVRLGLCSRLEKGQPVALWPFRDLRPEHEAFVAVNQLAVLGSFPLARTDIDFRPEAPATLEWRRQVAERSLRTRNAPKPPRISEGAMTRGQFARVWWEQIQALPVLPLKRATVTDADGDGTVDLNDPLLFDGRKTTWN